MMLGMKYNCQCMSSILVSLTIPQNLTGGKSITYLCDRLGSSKNRNETDSVEFQSGSCFQELVSCKKERKSMMLWSVTLYLYFDCFLL